MITSCKTRKLWPRKFYGAVYHAKPKRAVGVAPALTFLTVHLCPHTVWCMCLRLLFIPPTKPAPYRPPRGKHKEETLPGDSGWQPRRGRQRQACLAPWAGQCKVNCTLCSVHTRSPPHYIGCNQVSTQGSCNEGPDAPVKRYSEDDCEDKGRIYTDCYFVWKYIL